MDELPESGGRKAHVYRRAPSKTPKAPGGISLRMAPKENDGPEDASPPARVLYVVRHGPALERDPLRWANDDLRPLSVAGIRATRDVARGFSRMAPDVTVLITSPAQRAFRTARLLREGFALPPRLETWPELAPGSSPGPILERVREASGPGDVPALVGHEPTLGLLLGLCLTGEAIAVARLRRAGGAKLTFDVGYAPGGARLEWLLSRSHLIILGK